MKKAEWSLEGMRAYLVQMRAFMERLRFERADRIRAKQKAAEKERRKRDGI